MDTVPIMLKRADATPMLIEEGRAVRLARLPLGEHQYDEAWLQELLFRYPTLIPVGDIEPVFAPLIPVARELTTPSGPLDIFYVTAEGYPTLVETKLWRNPEARRQVVAQVIDYATQLSMWSYEDLLEAVKRARGNTTDHDPLVSRVKDRVEDWDEKRFVDTLSRNLRQGRMLLLIVGDGIHESVERMAETLSHTPQLGFALALVEIGLFQQHEGSGPIFVQPRIVTRTREVVRAVVEVRGESRVEDVRVTTPPADKSPKTGRRGTLTEEAFFEKLAEEASPQTAKELRDFLEDVEKRGVEVVPQQASISLHYYEPSNGARLSFGSVYVHARLDMFYVIYFFQAARFEQIGRDYLDDVARLVPSARAEVWDTKSGPGSAIKIGKRHATIQELLPQKAAWLAIIERTISRVNDTAKTTGSAA